MARCLIAFTNERQFLVEGDAESIYGAFKATMDAGERFTKLYLKSGKPVYVAGDTVAFVTDEGEEIVPWIRGSRGPARRRQR